MAVNVLHYRHDGATHWGVMRDRHVIPVAGTYATTGEFLRDGAERARALGATARGGKLSVDAVEVLCPVTRNQQFVCQAINYRSHMRESGIDPDRQPYNIFFTKAPSCLAPADADVVRPKHVKLLDYEVEIGLVMGAELTGARKVTAKTLHEVVAALVVVNDVSARDVQLPEGQFYKGKSYRTFGPVGPYLTLVDAADLARFDQLRLRLWVNGELRQNALAADMAFKPAPSLTELSGVQDLFPGDLLATGTPGGCAAQAPAWPVQFVTNFLPAATKWSAFISMGARNPRFLKPGDEMRATIATDDGEIDLGVQENRIVAG